MNIIGTDIVNPENDVFWDNAPLSGDTDVKPVLILISNYEPGSKEEGQLLKMLEVCRLQAVQYNIIKIADGQKMAWHKLREKMNPKAIFLIGIMPAQLGISAMFQINAPNNFNDRLWLPTVSLGELEQYPDVKKQLWLNGMKPLFVDKTFGGDW